MTITAAAGNLNPKMSTIYSYSGAGVEGSGTSAVVNTSSLAPGAYSVSCTVSEGEQGKEGQQSGEMATANATFIVKAFEPPKISCSAIPTTIKPGETSTITCNAVTSENLPLTFRYTASTGTVTGNGPTAVYSSTGAPTGVVGITSKVSDDKGNSASADVTVTIEAPPAPPQGSTSSPGGEASGGTKRKPEPYSIVVITGSRVTETFYNGVAGGLGSALSGSKRCNAFAVLGYPASIITEVTHQPLPHYFQLIVGTFDPDVGISEAEIAEQLCGVEGAPQNCLEGGWQKVAKGCNERNESFTDGKESYAYRIWAWRTGGKDLPGEVCATLVPPSAWIDKTGSPPNACPAKSGGTFSWQWSAMIKSDNFKGGKQLTFSISDAPQGGQTLFSSKFELTPIAEPRWTEVARWFEESVGQHLFDWIFGSGGLLVVLFGFVKRKVDEQRRLEPAAQFQPASVTPQINIIVAPAPRDPESGYHDPSPKRSRRRRPPGH